MTDSPRIKRPTLTRKEPIRNFSTLFSAPGKPADGPARLGPDEAVSRAVELGYRVVDEYIRQGERAAQRVAERSFGPAAIANDVQELTARVFQYASDFAGVWFELAGLTATGDVGRASFPWAAWAAPPEAPASAPPDRPEAATAVAPERTRLVVEVQCARPVEVQIDLRCGAEGRRLVVNELRASPAETPRLTDVAFVAASREGPAHFRVRVPDGHPAGAYSGMIIDLETSVPAGMLCVNIPRSDGSLK